MRYEEKTHMSVKEKVIRRVAALLIAIIGLGVIGALGFGYIKYHEAQVRTEKINALIIQADKILPGYNYDKALALLEGQKDLIDSKDPKDPITAKIKEINNMKNQLVKYHGDVQHIFFHSLIVYPELAFDNDASAAGYNSFMTTVTEFKRMLPLLEQKGYVLYPINQLWEINKDTGNMEPKDIYLPKGKKPLILSIDDVSYYKYMKHDGFASRLVMGKDNRVWTQVVTPEGKTVVTRDGDVMPILDDFVAKHPDFSWHGTKGIIALTGYEGVLGYRITDGLPQTDAWRKDVTKIADTLKAEGWLFACHSYTHNQHFTQYTTTLAQMKDDLGRWARNIAPYVGKTNIYVSPFGYNFQRGNPAHEYIIKAGYNVFCSVGPSGRLTFLNHIMLMPRVDLDGYRFIHYPDQIEEDFFPVDQVIDASRPPL
jgi:hypothetical protein